VYAGGRPLWHLSIAYQGKAGPVQVLRWSPATARMVENARDRIMAMCGTDEPLISPVGGELAALLRTRQWRKPLSIPEINQLAPTPEVRARPGRP